MFRLKFLSNKFLFALQNVHRNNKEPQEYSANRDASGFKLLRLHNFCVPSIKFVTATID